MRRQGLRGVIRGKSVRTTVPDAKAPHARQVGLCPIQKAGQAPVAPHVIDKMLPHRWATAMARKSPHEHIRDFLPWLSGSSGSFSHTASRLSHC